MTRIREEEDSPLSLACIPITHRCHSHTYLSLTAVTHMHTYHSQLSLTCIPIAHCCHSQSHMHTYHSQLSLACIPITHSYHSQLSLACIPITHSCHSHTYLSLTAVTRMHTYHSHTYLSLTAVTRMHTYHSQLSLAYTPITHSCHSHTYNSQGGLCIKFCFTDSKKVHSCAELHILTHCVKICTSTLALAVGNNMGPEKEKKPNWGYATSHIWGEETL